jgi:serpin B
MTKLLVALTALAMVAASCGDTAVSSTIPGASTSTTSPASPPPTSVRADLARADSTDTTDAEIAALVAGDTAFARDLFAAAASDGGNVIISPYSIAAALTMTYAGARANTATEMAAALHLALTDDRIHAARNELDWRITLPAPQPESDDREPFTIAVANSLWGHYDYPFLASFLETLAVDYDAGLNLVDFVASSEAARVAINTWVEDATNGRIADLIPEGVITSLTRLVIVNAIWFKANWAVPFDPDNTADGPFALLDGSTVVVPLMQQAGRFGYTTGDGYAAVLLPYAGDAAMRIILPDAGRFDAVRERFVAGDLGDLEFADFQVDLTMPKWEFTSEVGLKQALQSLGMVAAFTEPSLAAGADFTGITEARELFVHDVLHKAFIAVDEEGTEAAAATAVIIGVTSQPDTATMTIDRPFLFTIEHNSTGEVLFVGQVVDPS